MKKSKNQHNIETLKKLDSISTEKLSNPMVKSALDEIFKNYEYYTKKYNLKKISIVDNPILLKVGISACWELFNFFPSVEEIQYDDNFQQIIRLQKSGLIRKSEKLKMLENMLGNVPSEKVSFKKFPYLPNLKSLRINSRNINSFKKFPDLPNLEKFYLSNTHIRNFIGFPDLKSLNTAEFPFNSLKELKGFPSLTNLDHLDLSHNIIRDLSDFPYLPNLKSLFLSNNQIKDARSLKYVADNVPNLEILNLSCNPLSDLIDFPYFANLLLLDLSATKITNLESLKKLDKIRTLKLNSTNIESLAGCPYSKPAYEEIFIRKIRHGQYHDIFTYNLELPSHLKIKFKNLCRKKLFGFDALELMHAYNPTNDEIINMALNDELESCYEWRFLQDTTLEVKKYIASKLVPNSKLRQNITNWIENHDFIQTKKGFKIIK